MRSWKILSGTRGLERGREAKATRIDFAGDEAQGEQEKPEHEGADVEDIAKDVIEIAEAVKDGARMPLFDTHIIVDWSARSKPSPATPTKDAIWWAGARVDALRCLVRLIADEREAGRRVLVGFDFPFGYPEGVAAHLTGKASALALWDWLAERIEDAPNNANNRYEVAAAINATYPGRGPCWGRPGDWPFPEIPVRKSARTRQECHPPECRIADQRAEGAKTVWQLAYAGSVGSQLLLGLPALKYLIENPCIGGRAAVWPFETRPPGAEEARSCDRRGLSLVAQGGNRRAQARRRNSRLCPSARKRRGLRSAGCRWRSCAPF